MGVRVNHRSFVIERQLPGSPSHAFRFWSDHALKRRWTSCHPDWHVLEDRFSFKMDGSECLRWRMPDGTEHSMLAHYLEITEGERIVYAYTMRTGQKTISSSLVTVEFTPAGSTTLMTFTEQAMFPEAADGDVRESGTGVGFDRLIATMAECELNA